MFFSTRRTTKTVFFSTVLAFFIVFQTPFSSAASRRKDFEKAALLLKTPSTKAKGMRLLASLAKDAKQKKDYSRRLVGNEALAALAAEYRRMSNPLRGQILVETERRTAAERSKAMRDALALLKGHDDYARIADWRYSDETPGNPEILPFLELAHCEAVNRDAPEVRKALKALAFAESKTCGYDRALTLLTFAETLLDLSATDPANIETAAAKLAECLKYGDSWFKPKRISETGKTVGVPAAAAWRRLKNTALELSMDVELAGLARDYGPGYSLYVRMNKYRKKRNWLFMFLAARALKKKFPRSIYAQAAGLRYCQAMMMNERRKFLGGSHPSGEKAVERFVSESPYDLYRGEALMELGRFELEKRLDVEKAFGCYQRALDWFAKARERDDAVDLFALPAKVAKVAALKTPLTTLDKWRRTKYREPGDGEVLNRKTAPWYIGEMERECVFMTGFLLMTMKKFDRAAEHFSLLKKIDKNIALCVAKDIPNALWRLKAACAIGYMVFPPEESKRLKGDNRLFSSYAEFNYLIEKFDAAKSWFLKIIKSPGSSNQEKAVALIGIGACRDMTRHERKYDAAAEIADFKRAIRLAGEKSPIAGNALIRLGCYYQSSSATRGKCVKYFKTYLKRFPKGRYAEKALGRLGILFATENRRAGARKILAELEKKHPDSRFIAPLKRKLGKSDLK